MCGWHKYFGQLAKKSENPLFDAKYSAQVKNELLEIIDISEKGNTEVQLVTEHEIKEALKSLNTGKAADIFGVMAEHHLFASESLMPVLVKFMNNIFSNRTIPDIMKQGMLCSREKAVLQRLKTTGR